MPFNPFAAWPITGTWADHMSYSLGGEDYPTPYAFAFLAPASGILRCSGGSGEYKAGWVGSAGRRSILTLDDPIDDLAAIVFQHQSRFGKEGHYDEADPFCGYTGASANGVDWGGQVHMHWHGLDVAGKRLKLSAYITSGSSTAGLDDRPITEPTPEEEEMSTIPFVQVICDDPDLPLFAVVSAANAVDVGSRQLENAPQERGVSKIIEAFKLGETKVFLSGEEWQAGSVAIFSA